MNWGTNIVLAFIAFIALIGGIVYISMKQDVSLVARDYYKQEIAYQDQMQRIANFNALGTKPELNYHRSTKELKVIFPEEYANSLDNGKILLYRPSTSGLDVNFPIDLDANGEQVIDLQSMVAGKWELQLSWKADTEEYYHKKILIM